MFLFFISPKFCVKLVQRHQFGCTAKNDKPVLGLFYSDRKRGYQYEQKNNNIFSRFDNEEPSYTLFS